MSSEYFSGMAGQLSTASMMGKPASRASVVFVGPARFDAKLTDPDKGVIPLGMMASIMTQDSRTNISQEVMGMDEQVDLGYQKGRKIGAVTGLVLFLPENVRSNIANNKGEVWSHFLKGVYAWVRKNHPNLIKPFYAVNKTSDTFFEPVAYDDSDGWRNFSSQLFSVPVGLYELVKAEGGRVLKATYYENVRLEGSLSSNVQVGQMGPQFEQFGFTYSKALPMNPSTDIIAGAADTGNSNAVSADWQAELKNYLGLV